MLIAIARRICYPNPMESAGIIERASVLYVRLSGEDRARLEELVDTYPSTPSKTRNALRGEQPIAHAEIARIAIRELHKKRCSL